MTGGKKTIGGFTFHDTGISGLIVIDPMLHGDERGWFMETYRADVFSRAGIDVEFVQDNQSFSARGTLRGMHYQIEHPQAKLVRVLSGAVFDVAVDLRGGSETFGKWFGTVLSAENRQQLFIPRGFAHGFLVLSDTAEFCYKCDDVYHPGDEGGIAWNDPALGIEWPSFDSGKSFDPTRLILSDKDRSYARFDSKAVKETFHGLG